MCTNPLDSSPSHLIISTSLIEGCHVAFAMGACIIITARSIRVPISQIQIVVGRLSILVARRVPELSSDMKFVPVLGSILFVVGAPAVGGHIVWVAGTNSRTKAPVGDGLICSCQIFSC